MIAVLNAIQFMMAPPLTGASMHFHYTAGAFTAPTPSFSDGIRLQQMLSYTARNAGTS
jgi:hypothetical protein